MKKVEIKDRQIVVDNNKIPLLSGEVHYWRMDPYNWGKVLDSIKETGLNLICSYVQWEYHEYEKGKYDFEGKTRPQRNLVEFLKLVEEKKLWLIIRPGPYTYTEWINMGVPTYVAKYHRMHPKFLEAASKYISEVTKIIKPYLATNGGPIVMLQADNEINIFEYFYQEDLGLNGQYGMFHDFLKNKYKKIELLNDFWCTDYKDFAEVYPTMINPNYEKKYLKRFLDFRDFCMWYGGEYAKWVIREYKNDGIDIPISLNCFIDDSENFREIQKIADVIAPDYYPSNEFVNNVKEKYLEFDDKISHRFFMDLNRYSRTYAKIPFIGELGCGQSPEFSTEMGLLSRNHYRLVILSLMLAGVAGWNWYMLVNRDNWALSIINERGWKRVDLFLIFKNIIEIFKKINVPELEKLSETSVTFDYDNYSNGLYDKKDPVLTGLYNLDVDYEFFDVETGIFAKKILFYSGQKWLSRKGQENLLNYVNNGGHLVFFTTYPELDNNMKDYNLLEILEPRSIEGQQNMPWYPCDIEVTLGQLKARVEFPPVIFNYAGQDGIEIIKARRIKTLKKDEVFREEEEYMRNSLLLGREINIGYEKKAGKGTIMLIGVKPSSDLILKIHQYYNVPIFSRSLTSGISTGVFKSQQSHFLVVVNNGNEDKCAKIKLDKFIKENESYKCVDIETGETEILNSGQKGEININLSRKDGKVIEII